MGASITPAGAPAMVIREIRLAAAAFVLTSFAIIGLHLLLK
jgi:hypothetical protein